MSAATYFAFDKKEPVYEYFPKVEYVGNCLIFCEKEKVWKEKRKKKMKNISRIRSNIDTYKK
jgi:hypothetical protein